ncbi:hypothetical protein BD410DRAFT_736841 [Rickenella mellea]|uniref:Arginyl-tRNA--protein transferase 1 n=1 Tax=Rickenella mellea TaxID=50990 RepID=A0A4R5XHH5_9AGAM|nr:hypothetical protein BD410DRAFT_736841 [Rickenella mellea]
MTEVLSILRPFGNNRSTCGYCGPQGQRSSARSSFTVGSEPLQLSCDAYQKMIDRGWRRSGTYCYKPDLRRSCCPQYTIKLDANEFTPSKSQRKVIARWNRHIIGNSEKGHETSPPIPSRSHDRGKSRADSGFSLINAVHAAERDFILSSDNTTHIFEVALESSSFTQEKYALYEKYQQTVHYDYRNSQTGFIDFLVDTPLVPEPIPYTRDPPKHLPQNYGSYHQLYRLDGKLIAMAVLDILPSCVSSVYFMYDAEWERFSLGKASALREASLAKEIHEHGALDMKYLYMGFYIHSCQKMRYKGDYSPSFLLDPVDYTWHPLQTCVKLLEKNRYACFSQPERSLSDPADPGPLPDRTFSTSDLDGVNVIDSFQGNKITLRPIIDQFDSLDTSDGIGEVIEGLGVELSRTIIFMID